VRSVTEAEARRFDADIESPRLARAWAAPHLERWHLGHHIPALMIVLSELATNAVIHAHTPFTVTLELADGELRVKVSDDSPRPPVPREAAPEEVGGRGLVAVAGLTDRWGSHRQGAGKVVWAELAVA
jgi:anti-sigma regulatory factor (Ser/Thr protein kinase)